MYITYFVLIWGVFTLNPIGFQINDLNDPKTQPGHTWNKLGVEDILIQILTRFQFWILEE